MLRKMPKLLETKIWVLVMKNSKYSELSIFNKSIVSQMIDMALDVSSKMLEKENAFYPFALSCDAHRKFKIIGLDGHLLNDTNKSVIFLREVLNRDLNEKSSIAASLIYDVIAHNAVDKYKTDAICIDMRIEDTFFNRFLYPYKSCKDKIEYGSPWAEFVDYLF